MVGQAALDAHVHRAIPSFMLGGAAIAAGMGGLNFAGLTGTRSVTLAALDVGSALALLAAWAMHRGGRLRARRAQPIVVAFFLLFAALIFTGALLESRPYALPFALVLPPAAAAILLSRRALAVVLAGALPLVGWLVLPLAWGSALAIAVLVTAVIIPLVIHENRLRAHAELIGAVDAARQALAAQRTLFVESPLPKWVYDDATLKIIDVNRAAIRHYGYTREQFLAMDLRDLRPREDVAAFLERRARRDPDGVRHVQSRHVKADGTVIDVSVTAAPVRILDRPAVIATAEDVTERVRAEEALRQSQKRFELLAKATRDVVYDWNVVTGDVWRNENHEKAFGHGDDAKRGVEAWTARIHPDDRERVRAGLEAAIAGGNERWESEYRYRRGSGDYALVYDRGCILRDASGKPCRMLGSMQDVTAIRRAQEAMRRQERLSSLGTLVAGVAHEINNPLTYVRGNVELTGLALQDALADPTLSDEARRALAEVTEEQQRVLHGLDQLARIAQSLRQVARVGNGERSPQDVNALAESVADVARTRTKGDVDIDLSLEASRLVEGNAGELSQVLLNLLFNAADAVRERPGARIRVSTRDADGDVVVEVEDNGVGIAPEDAARIFTPFHTTKAEGTGLGLSVSYAIARDHGGCLTFHSEPGAGTTFRLTLPALRPLAAAKA